MILDTPEHPKFRRLKRLLNLPQYAVIGLLESLWMLASRFADEGDISRFSAQEIADYCEYEGDADSLLNALVEAKWIDRTGDTVLIHDWFDHCPDFIHERIKKRNQRKTSRTLDADSNVELSRDSSAMSRDCPAPVPECPATVPDCPATVSGRPEQSAPSHSLAIAEPSHNQKKSKQLASLPAAEFFRLVASDREVLGREADRLFKQYPRIDRNKLREIAFIAFFIDRGLVSDLIEKVKRGTKDGPVRNPLKFMTAIVRSEVNQIGYTWDEAASCVPPLAVSEELVVVA